MTALATTPRPGSLDQGYAAAKRVTRAHAKSFAFASLMLFGHRRRAAFALYALCRRLDDLVDGDAGGDIAVRLEAARTAIRLATAAPTEPFSGVGAARTAFDATATLTTRQAAGPLPWHPSEFTAFKDTAARFGLTAAPLEALIDGMAMDLTKSRYRTFEELDLYCYRVAGVVGELLCPVLGATSPEARRPAIALGRAMQLTNILRDLGEDLGRGRVYLPQDELAAFGVTEEQLQAGRVDRAFVRLMQFQIARARALYAEAAQGLHHLTAFAAPRMVGLMGAIYGDLLTRIEANGYDVFSTRVFVPTRRKLLLAGKALWSPRAALPKPDTHERALLVQHAATPSVRREVVPTPVAFGATPTRATAPADTRSLHLATPGANS